eukprot:scaffold30139_cov25-Tisochrysis_lutea.AAC.1
MARQNAARRRHARPSALQRACPWPHLAWVRDHTVSARLLEAKVVRSLKVVLSVGEGLPLLSVLLLSRANVLCALPALRLIRSSGLRLGRRANDRSWSCGGLAKKAMCVGGRGAVPYAARAAKRTTRLRAARGALATPSPPQRDGLVYGALLGQLRLQPRSVLVRLGVPLFRGHLSAHEQVVVVAVAALVATLVARLLVAILTSARLLLPALPNACRTAHPLSCRVSAALVARVKCRRSSFAQVIAHRDGRRCSLGASFLVLAIPLALAALVILPLLVREEPLLAVNLGLLLPDPIDRLQDLEVELLGEQLAVRA